jgi:hypothetical protein
MPDTLAAKGVNRVNRVSALPPTHLTEGATADTLGCKGVSRLNLRFLAVPPMSFLHRFNLWKLQPCIFNRPRD